MNTLPLRKITLPRRLTIFLPIGIMLVLFTYLSNIGAQDELDGIANHVDSRDMLAYVSDEGQLMLYDLYNRTETMLLENVNGFVLSRDGRIAFTKPDDTDLYVFDPSTPALAPINISQNLTANHYPVAWSSDGHYLAFSSYEDRRDQSLYVWDGEQVTNIMPDNRLDTADAFYVDWSHDRRLAFTIQHGWSDLDVPPEIYLWNGSTTINVSQNTEGFDSASRWSRTGQLMFGSSRDEVSNIYMWDGVSYSEDLPDINSFVPLAPELRLTYPRWTDEDGIVAFTLDFDTSSTGQKEVIWWDIEAEIILRRYLVASDKAWSWLAEGGQMVLSSQLASGIPSVYLDVENTEGEIVFSEHVGEFSWSSDGYLAYCGITEEGQSRLLSIWDGNESWVVAEVSYRAVQWQNGRDTFSCNNG